MRPVILHVDDDEANRYAVRKILDKAGYEVIEAENGTRGLERTKSDLPDLVILDIKLPDINGYDVCKQIKNDEMTKSIPVLQTSASFVTSEHKVTGLESGADGYLAQPIEGGVLVATVRSLLRIREAEKTANHAIRSREELLHIVSHDLRNPLTFIMLQTKILEAGIKNNQISVEDSLNKLKRINNSCHKMNRMIQDILDVSNIETGKLALKKINFKMSEMFDEIKEFFEEISLQSEITLHFEDNGIGDQIINADKEKLMQVLSNLVSNSLKFTQSGGQIYLSFNNAGKDKVQFTVSDTGSGIAADHLPHVFNRYWKGHPERKSGYGIGLSIVKGVIEAHGGSINIESKEGVGTKITFVIPG